MSVIAETESASGVVQELRDCLRRGTSMDELWKVARGEVKYADFASKSQKQQKPSKQSTSKPSKQQTAVPDELVSH